MSLPLLFRGKVRVDRRDESLFLFLEILPGEIRTSAPGRFTRSLPGEIRTSLPGRPFQFFPILTFKGSFPFFSKFYRSWKLRFRFPVISCALPKISKKVSSWEESPPEISKKVSSWKERRFLPFTVSFFQKKFSKNFQKC